MASATASSSAVALPALDLITAGSLGLGFVCLLRRGRPPKTFSAAIGAAHGALKGSQILGHLRFPPSPDGLFVASKALIKGYKASKRMNLIGGLPGPGAPSSVVPKEVVDLSSNYLRALSLLSHGRRFLLGGGGEAVGLGFLNSGYKFSLNCFKLLESCTGVRFDSAIKGGLDAAGLTIKAAVIVAEIRRIAVARIRRRRFRCGSSRGSSPKSRYLIVHSKQGRVIPINSGFELVKSFSAGRSVASTFEQPSVMSCSELLCLSIPLSSRPAP